MDKNSLMVRDVPMEERPREKLLKFGPEYVSTSDLLAIILRTGSKNESVMQLAMKILSEFETLQNLYHVTIEELMQIKGVGEAKAVEIKAAIEFGKRIVQATPLERETIRSPKDVFSFLGEDMKYLKQEHFVALLLNTKNHILAKETISIGSLNASIVHPREVFKPAIKKSASAIIVAHNHPSGDPTPSKEDIEVTKRLSQVGELLGIDLLDHVVIGEHGYISLKEKGLIG